MALRSGVLRHQQSLGGYLSGYKVTPWNVRLLHRAIHRSAGCEEDFRVWTCSNVNTECAYYPKSKKLVIINNSGSQEETDVADFTGNSCKVSLEPHGIKIIDL